VESGSTIRPVGALNGRVIFTERLVLEPLAVSHAEEMAAVLDDPALHTFIGGTPASPAELNQRYARLAQGPPPGSDERWLNWVLRRRDDSRLIGTVQATITAHGTSAAIAWVIGTPWHGRGYATEAARALVDWLRARDVSDVTATIHPDHTASAAVARHAGLEPTTELVDGEIVWRAPR
jgi:RimJ/RimL family protein N-acetyltransferase